MTEHRGSGLTQILNLAAGARARWEGSRLLRLGALTILLIVASEGLTMMGAQADDAAREVQELQSRNEKLRSQTRQAGWVQRQQEAEKHLKALELQVWQAADDSLMQANLRDWLGAMAGKMGLGVRDLVVSRQQSASGGTAGGASTRALSTFDGGPGIAATAAPQTVEVDQAGLAREGVEVWRARMSMDFRRNAMMAFLNELGAHPQGILVERLHLRLNAQPATASLELRMLGRSEGAKR